MGMPRKCQERLTGPGIAVLGPRQQKARLGVMRGPGRASGVAGAEIRFETTRWGEVGLSFEKSPSEIKSGG